MKKNMIFIFILLYQVGFTSEIIILHEKIYKDTKYNFESEKIILKNKEINLRYNYNKFDGLEEKVEIDKIQVDYKNFKIAKINFKENKGIMISGENIFILNQDLYEVGYNFESKNNKISNKFSYLKNNLNIGTRYGKLELKNQKSYYNILKIYKLQFLHGRLDTKLDLNGFEMGKLNFNTNLLLIGNNNKIFFGKISQKSYYNIDYKITGLIGIFEEYKYESAIDIWVYGVNYKFKKGNLKVNFILGSILEGKENKIDFFNETLKGYFPFKYEIIKESKKYKIELDKPFFGNLNINYEKNICKSIFIGIDKNFPFANGIKIKEENEETEETEEEKDESKKGNTTKILNYLKSGSKIYFKIKF